MMIKVFKLHKNGISGQKMHDRPVQTYLIMFSIKNYRLQLHKIGLIPAGLS